MKRTITALLLTLTMLLGLSGCTSKKDDSNTNVPDNHTTQNGSTTDNYAPNNGVPNNGNTNNGTQNGGTNSGDAGNGTMNNGTANNNNAASRSYNSYAQPGVNGPTSSDSVNDLLRGRSYEEMLRNGRVHDTDGFLTDGENSVSQW